MKVGRLRHPAFAIACVLALTSAAAAELILVSSEKVEGEEKYLRTFDHNDDVERQAWIMFPTDDPAEREPVYPVVFWLHGTTPDLGGEEAGTYFDGLYDGELGQKFIAVIPLGLAGPSGNYAWNHAPIDGITDPPTAELYEADDLGFLHELTLRL